MKKALLLTLAALTLAGCAHLPTGGVASKPLFRDPVYDGAADASIVYDKAAKDWKMFYTNRRATGSTAPPSVSRRRRTA